MARNPIIECDPLALQTEWLWLSISTPMANLAEVIPLFQQLAELPQTASNLGSSIVIKKGLPVRKTDQARMAARRQQEHSAESYPVKVELRQRVVKTITPLRVLDAFAGHGSLYRDVWHQAERYLGIDARYLDETPPIIKGDNRQLLRKLDLSLFNVFDFDAYGSPWEQLAILAKRRHWRKGERGAVILTDGISIQLRFGRVPDSLADLAGLESPKVPPSDAIHPDLQHLTLAAWVVKSKVKPLYLWKAQGSNRKSRLVYLALVFEGMDDAQ
jgi:hypothetical protein